MKEKIDIIKEELERLSSEARLQARSKRPDLALQRFSHSLLSLLKSLEDRSSEQSPLTQREEEILQHVSQGFTNREIATALVISEKTIEFHLKSVFSKTFASTRTEAVKNALEKGWIR